MKSSHVGSVNDAVDYQGLDSVFRLGLHDAAVDSALCLTLAFAANGGTLDKECTAYRLKAIQCINERLSDHAKAASNTTMGAVLLLVGVEVRTAIRRSSMAFINGTCRHALANVRLLKCT